MKKRYLVLLLFGVILLGFGIVSLASIESIVQDRYLVVWICNILIATGTAVLYLSYAVFRNDRASDLADARAAAAEAEKEAKAAQIVRLEKELTQALDEIKKLKQ